MEELGLIRWSSGKTEEGVHDGEEAEEGLARLEMDKDEGIFRPFGRNNLEELLAADAAEAEGGVEGVDEGVFWEIPKSCLDLKMKEWRRLSGPNASLIISFSP